MKLYTFRLHPGDDLRLAIEKFVQDQQIKAGAVVSCVGSLRQAKLRLADETIIKRMARKV